MKNKPILIVGAGFSGAVIARLLAEAGHRIDVIDKRNHVAGNAYDYVNSLGIRVHKYGPHLFHTSNHEVVNWLSKFTEWTPYQHKVKALLKNGHYVTLPVNRETKEVVGEENVIDTFFRPYTFKMWGLPIEEVNKEIINRVPIRDDMNELYFPNDSFQALPSEGYESLIKNMLDHPMINIKLNKSFDSSMEKSYFKIFNSMPIDEYFSYSLGKLPYRSVKFHTYDLPIPKLLPVATVNFTHSEKYSRVTEWKNLPSHGESESHTTLTVEEPCAYEENDFERYYPIKDNTGNNHALYKEYEKMVPENMIFIGRCGKYKYLDMHQAVSLSFKIADDFLKGNS